MNRGRSRARRRWLALILRESTLLSPRMPHVGFVWIFRILHGHRFHRRRPAFVLAAATPRKILIPTQVNYPRILQQEELGNLWSVTNYGVSGRTLNGNSNLYTDEPEYEAFLDEGADAVIILLGTNDAQFGFGGGDDFADEAFVDAYKALIEEIVDETEPKAILLGVPPPVLETDYSSGKWHIPTIDMMSDLIIKVKKWAKKEYKNIYIDDVDFYESLQRRGDAVAAAAGRRRAIIFRALLFLRRAVTVLLPRLTSTTFYSMPLSAPLLLLRSQLTAWRVSSFATAIVIVDEGVNKPVPVASSGWTAPGSGFQGPAF